MNKINLCMFSLIRSALSGEPVTDSEKSYFSKDMLKNLVEISREHDLSHLVGVGLIKNCLIDGSDEYFAAFQMAMFEANCRYEKIKSAYSSLCETLEDAKIKFLPLKGSVIRSLYREPWHRTSSDIDVLVQKSDFKPALKYLTNEKGYVKFKKTPHDVSLLSPNGAHIELHFNLVEDGLAKNASNILADVWNYSKPKEGFKYFYEMSDEMFYFYHIAHMAKHFEYGGCGIRTVTDLWILGERNTKERDNLLKSGGLLKFADSMRKLYKIWFEGENFDSDTEFLEEYIVSGGVYGNLDNQVALLSNKKGGKLKYVLYKVFPPFKELKVIYPALAKGGYVAYPLMFAAKWSNIFKKNHFKHMVDTLKKNKNLSQADEQKNKNFLEYLGLK